MQMSRGETYERRGFKPTRVWYDTAPDYKRGLYSGRRWNRLTILGKVVDRGTNQPNRGTHSVWVVRCDCGVLESRNSRAIRRAIDEVGMCQFCAYDLKVRAPTTKTIMAPNFFDAMRAEARRLGLAWTQRADEASRTFVSIAGRPEVRATELMRLETLERFRSYVGAT